MVDRTESGAAFGARLRIGCTGHDERGAHVEVVDLRGADLSLSSVALLGHQDCDEQDKQAGLVGERLGRCHEDFAKVMAVLICVDLLI